MTAATDRAERAPARHHSLYWRWSWRDLRQHWVAVLSIAFVIAIGTGVYAGLGSTAEWRRQTNDASFSALRIHDLRAALSTGTFAPAGELAGIVATLPHASDIEAVTERLVVESSIDASTPDDTILVASRIVGSPFGEPGTIDDLWLRDGTMPVGGTMPAQAVLEAKFADYYGLPGTGTVAISGGTTVAYTGRGSAAEDLYVIGPAGSLLGEADMGVLYTDLATAQELTGRAGQVNDVVLTLRPGADRDVVEQELQAALDATEGISAAVTNRDEAEAYRILYEDIENDQQIWNALSALVLLAAALAAFNLISRIVDAQRREIGIGMALGVTRRRLALRPVLIGVQVGVIGTIGGIAVGYIVGGLMRNLLESLLPMPDYRTPFQVGVYARGALLGLVPPIVASVLPVWRAVRVEPIQAIRTGHLAASTGRLSGWASHVRLPGSAIAQMPVRNILRSPRRTVLTAVGVGAAITALVAVLGMLDSFQSAIDTGVEEVSTGSPDRIAVTLDTYYPATAPVVTGVRTAPEVGDSSLSLHLPGTLSTTGADDGTGTSDDDIDVLLTLLDMDGAIWAPSAQDAVAAGASSGLVIPRKAAEDLGVRPGDSLVLTHPQLTADGPTMVETTLTVAALTPMPMRTFAYLDDSFAASFGLAGVTNALQVLPASGVTRDELQRGLFARDGVALLQPIGRIGEAFDEALAQFIGFLAITAGAVLLLALLIAFNSTRISVEERRREHATMLAFGMKVRTVVGLVGREAVAIGLLSTVIGVVAGTLALRWILDSLAERTLPDFDIPLYIAPATIVIATIVGVVAVSLAPLFLVRRVRRMNLPDTLRVME